VFHHEGGGVWEPTKKLTNTLLVGGYGWSLVVREGVLLIGVLSDQGRGGSVRVWTYGAAGWTEEAVLLGSDAGPFESNDLGWSVAYDGERAIAGGPSGGPSGGDNGAAYVYGPASLPVASDPPVPSATVATLSAPEPNPFRDRTALHLSLLRPQRVEAALYDVLGRRVRLLHAGPLSAGTHALVVGGSALAPGLYVVRVTGEGFVRSQRLVRTR
jgi:hypothetical protein